MTAHHYWEAVWRTEEGRANWSQPHPWVAGSVDLLRDLGALDVLDLGCGVGRHAIFLAREGFFSHGVDKSSSAIAFARGAANQHGVVVALAVGDATALPYAADSFNFVRAFNVVYHADEDGLRRTLAEVRRVLRPGGIYQSTMLSKRNKEYGRGIEVSANTFCQPNATDDKVHPHLYADAADLVRLHEGFELISLTAEEHLKPGSHHWHCRFKVTVPPVWGELAQAWGRNGSEQGSTTARTPREA